MSLTLDRFADLATQFRDIPGVPGYRVCGDGRVQSDLVKGTRTGRRTSQWRDLKPSLNRRGHTRVNIAGKVMMIHSLVLSIFEGSCPDGMECLHGDGNPSNNRLTNLRWGTRAENVGDAMLHGTTPSGEKHWNARVPDSAVQKIRQLHLDGWKVGEIALELSVKHQYVSRIIKGQRRTQTGGES